MNSKQVATALLANMLAWPFAGAQTTLYSVHGEADNDGLASAVPVGDVDQDGFADFALGNGGTDGTFQNEGTVMVLSACDGALRSYGSGVPGAGGFEPRVEAAGCPVTGEALSLEVRLGLGGSPGMLVMGLNSMQVPLLGGVLLVEPLVFFPHVLGGQPDSAGDGALSFPISPLSPALAGVSLYFQAAYFDLFAPFSVSLTAGLELELAP